MRQYPFEPQQSVLFLKLLVIRSGSSNADILGKKETAVSNNSKVKSFEPKLYHF